jgi:hypothetical protein
MVLLSVLREELRCRGTVVKPVVINLGPPLSIGQISARGRHGTHSNPDAFPCDGMDNGGCE